MGTIKSNNVEVWKPVKDWESINDIYRDLKISKGNISNCCNYKRNSAGGYIWRFVNE